MNIIAEFTVPFDEFALYKTLCEVPEMIVEVERVVAHEPDRIMPYFWASNGDNEGFEPAAKNDPSVDDLTKLDELDEAVLYRANWVQDVQSVIYAYTETGAVLLDATGRNEQWDLQLRFDTEDDITQFKEYMDENNMSMTWSVSTNPHVQRQIPRQCSRRRSVRRSLQDLNQGIMRSPARPDQVSWLKSSGFHSKRSQSGSGVRTEP